MMNEILFGVMLVLAIGLVVALIWVFVLEKRISERRNHFEWIMSASDIYLFEHDIGNDELWFSPQCAKLMDVPLRIPHFSEVAKTTKDSTLKRGLAYANKILACQKEVSRLELLDTDGHMGIFEVSSKNFHNQKGTLVSRVGILVDITREVREKEALRAKTERDDVSGLLSADMVRFLIERTMREQAPAQTGAFALMTVESLRAALPADDEEQEKELLRALSEYLHAAMRDGDFVGRLTRDMLCLYLPSKISFSTLCHFAERMRNVAATAVKEDPAAGIVVGAVLIREGDDFATVDARAREALIKAREEATHCYAVGPDGGRSADADVE